MPPSSMLAFQQGTAPWMDLALASTGTVDPFSMLAPLGIDPFLALGLLGLGVYLAGGSLEAPLTYLPEPAVWIGLLALALLLKVGRSFKLTKPFAEVAGTAESVAGVVALLAMFATSRGAVPDPAATASMGGDAVQAAGVLGTTLLAVAAVSGLLAVIVVRMGFDLLTWLSPVPLVDAALQLAKLLATAALVALALVAPGLAIVLNVVILVMTVIAARWLFRVTRFTGALLWDFAFGRFGSEPAPISGDAVGPIHAYTVGSDCGLARLCPVRIQWTPEGWSVLRGEEGAAPLFLGSSAESSLERGTFGTSLRTPRAHLLLTARYHRHLEAVARRTGTPVHSKGTGPAPVPGTGPVGG